MTAPDDAPDPYADVWHQGRDCTYQCGLTGRTILAHHDDRYVAVAEDDYMRLREALQTLLIDVDEGEVVGGDPGCVDLRVTVNRTDLQLARAALTGEEDGCDR